MHRRSLIKCILGLVAAPKILAEMNFKPPIVAKELEAYCFEGIIPLINASANIVEYVPGNFTLDHMYDFVKNYYHGNETKSI